MRRTAEISPRPVAILAALAFVAALGAGCGPARSQAPPAAVATVHGNDLSADEFSARYGAYLAKSGLPDRPALRQTYLDHLIGVKLIVQAARDGGVEEDAAYRVEQESVRRKLLLDAYAERDLLAAVEVTDQDLREMFVRANTRLKARHLYARTRAQADALHERLQRGETFEALAREVFADSALAHSGGSLGTFGFDEMDPAFEDAAYGLAVGAVSEPVRTAFGYSIIHLEDRQAHPLLTESEFVRKKKQMRLLALRRKRTEALFQHSQALADALRLTFHDATLARLMRQIEGAALLPGGEEAAAWLAAPLVTFGPEERRQTWTVAAFRERAQYTAETQRAQVVSLDHLKAFVAGLAAREEMQTQAQQAGYDALPVFREALEQHMEQWIYRRAVERLRAEAVVPEDAARAYFEAHRDALAAPEKVRVGEILLETKADADAVKAQVPDASFEALARVHSVRPGAAAAGGDLGFVSRDQLGRLAAPVFEAAEGAVVGPLEVAGRYVLLKVGVRQAARPARFEEVRAEIEARLRAEAEPAQIQAHVAALRTRYEVVVYPEVLARLTPVAGRLPTL